jgi:hypothetical protein
MLFFCRVRTVEKEYSGKDPIVKIMIVRPKYIFRYGYFWGVTLNIFVEYGRRERIFRESPAFLYFLKALKRNKTKQNKTLHIQTIKLPLPYLETKRKKQ